MSLESLGVNVLTRLLRAFARIQRLGTTSRK
jgi:hypothetical protein